MKQYKGIIFNSKNVETLKGSLGQAVRERNIRTAVVSRKNRMEVRRMLKAAGVKVDVIVGGLDLNTKYTQFIKPMSDPVLVAVAMMHLEAEDVAVLGDYFGDRQSAFAAGLDYYTRPVELMARLGGNPAETKAKPDYSGYKVPVTGIIGAICGDVIGSAYEFHPTEDYNFAPFVKGTHVTDDSVATLAVAKWLMGDRTPDSLVRSFLGVCNRHPNAGYGPSFKRWLRGKDHSPYGGRTNGAQMRVSPCGWVADSLEETLDIAKRSAEVSHNSKEGIEGAQAFAAAIFLLRTGHGKAEVKAYVERQFGYDLDVTVEQHRSVRSKNYVCSQSGPEAFRCWLEADTYEQAIRNAVTLRTDADTVADMAGALAAATPGMAVPQEWADRVFAMLDDELKELFVAFCGISG